MSLSLLERVALLPPGERARFLDEAPAEVVEAIHRRDWSVCARPEQLPPDQWDHPVWLIMAGRGFGKTKTGGETVMDCVREFTPHVEDGAVRVALVSRRLKDVRLTMVEGESGLARCVPPSMLRGGSWEDSWNRGSCELKLATGAIFQGYSSEAPDDLRGPQHHIGWGDEPASWRDSALGIGGSEGEDTTYFHLLAGLRLTPGPRLVLTGTPKSVLLIKQLVKEPEVIVTSGSTYDNLQNLSPVFRKLVVDRYAGTRLGRQELDGELLESAGTLFQRQWVGPAVSGPLPNAIARVRVWDLAGSTPSDAYPDPDWTVGVKLAKDAGGIYRVEHVERFRKTPGARNERIVEVALADNLPVMGVEQEPGSGGKAQVEELQRTLEKYGIRVKATKPGGSRETDSPDAKKNPKVARAEPWLGVAENQRLQVADFDEYMATLDEWEGFPTDRHDDIVDGMSGAFDLINHEPEPIDTPGPGGAKKKSDWR